MYPGQLIIEAAVGIVFLLSFASFSTFTFMIIIVIVWVPEFSMQ